MKIKILNLCAVLLWFFLACTCLSAAPAAPGALQHVSNTTSSITWTWRDNSNNEQGFRCYEWYWDNALKRYVLSQNPVWSVNANVTSYVETGLAPNTQYRRVIVAWNNEYSLPRHERSNESPKPNYDNLRNQYYYDPATGDPTYDPPSYLVAVYTSIQPPAGLVFGPKGQTELTVKLAEPLPSNLTSSGSSFGYFVPNNSGFYIENLETGKNLSSTSFPSPSTDPNYYKPAPPISGGDGWWKYNDDYDPLPALTGVPPLSNIFWYSYLKNGPATYNASATPPTYSSNHLWPYWCVEGLSPNTPYTFRAKARNGDRDETAWTSTSQQVWTLPKAPDLSCDKQAYVCYDPGTKFTFSSNIPFGIGHIDHYHIKWTTNPAAIPSEEDLKWSAGDWVITENRGGDWYLVVTSHNAQHEEPITYRKPIPYNIDGTPRQAIRVNVNGTIYIFNEGSGRNFNILTYGPYKIGYDVQGKVTISGGTGSYTDVVVHCGGYTTNCNALGEFSFSHLPPGTYDVYPELTGYRIAFPVENAGHRSIKLPDPDDAPQYIKTGVDFTLAYKNTYTIAGKVSFVGGPGGTPSDITQVTIRCGSYTPVNPDSKGNFYIPGVFAGTYKLRASIPSTDPDYQYYEITFPTGGEYTVSVGPDATGKDFVFTWKEGIETASISGRIKLIGGTGDVTKATVYCKNLNTGVEGTASPNNTGAYQFANLTKGNDYEIRVKMDGYKVTRVRISDAVWSDTQTIIRVNNLQNDVSNKDFELVPILYYSVRGKLDVSEGVIKPPDVKLHLDCTSDTSISFTLHPEPDGTYIFTNIPEGTYTLYPEIPAGYKITNPVSGRYTGIVLGPDSQGNNFLIEPIAKYSLSGKITLQGGTCRPNEALVVCQYYNSVKKEYIIFTTIPDSSGIYKFTNLAPANYSLSVTLSGYITIYPTSGSHAVTITNKDISGKDFYLVSYAIKGKVSFITPSVEPVTNVMIVCSAVSKNPDVPSVYKVTHPDSGGNYAFYNLMPSSKLANPAGGAPVPYRVEVFLEGYGVISPSAGYYDVIITNKDEQKDFILGTYSVSGKLTLYSGTADLTKATVTAAKLDKAGGNET
ncbi:MAG: hypothetical protein N2115_00765, partial [bacterium]|nr:hypothetical protein [bacterium]